MSGRMTQRERKSTEFFAPADVIKSEAKTVVEQGDGSKLGEIPNVNFKLDKQKGSAELLENLHQLLFKSKGKAHSRKKDIKAFSGFAYSNSSKEVELEKLESRLEKWTGPQLNSLLDLLDIPRGSGEDGIKGKKIERLKVFLLKPTALSKKDLAAQAEKKKDKSKAAKTKSASKAGPTKPASAKKVGAAAAASPQAPASGKKRKAPASQEQPAKKAKKQADKVGKGSATPAKRWPPAKDLKADVEFVFQSGLDRGDEMTMGKIYAELATKYGMTSEEVKAKKAQIKTIVKNYEAQLEVEGKEEVGAAEAMDVDEQAGAGPVVTDAADTEGDEKKDEVAVQAANGPSAQPEGTRDVQPAEPSQLETSEAPAEPEPAAAPAPAEPVLITNLPPSGPIFEHGDTPDVPKVPEPGKLAQAEGGAGVEKPTSEQQSQSVGAPASLQPKDPDGTNQAATKDAEQVTSNSAEANATDEALFNSLEPL